MKTLRAKISFPEKEILLQDCSTSYSSRVSSLPTCATNFGLASHLSGMNTGSVSLEEHYVTQYYCSMLVDTIGV